MSSLAHSAAAFSIELGDRRHARTGAPDSLTLRATEDGWALLRADGQVVFHALGVRGRRQCLEFARRQGVISVFS
jgi:hypothetical protein